MPLVNDKMTNEEEFAVINAFLGGKTYEEAKKILDEAGLTK